VWRARSSVVSCVQEDDASFAVRLADHDPLPFLLAGGAHFVWQALLEAPGPAEAITVHVAEVTGESPATVGASVREVLEQLRRAGLATTETRAESSIAQDWRGRS